MSAETVRRGYECLNEGDLDGALALWDPDVVCVLPEGGINTGRIEGRDKVRGFLSHYLDTFDSFRMHPERFVEAEGGRVVAFVEMTGAGKGSGLEFKTRQAHVCTVGDEGLVTRIEVFTEGGKGALESVGLSSDD
ncbi:MAG TPA: nuclear transport factor 2 family protein [Solirubrobacterales bacterium]|nr:nuclear transport factor 2 family protein [Solirubrobacterales bacterium]